MILPHCGRQLWGPPVVKRDISLWDEGGPMQFFYDNPNVYFDSGPGYDPLLFPPPAGDPNQLQQLEKVLKIVGPERIICGSDSPYWPSKLEVEKLLQLDLSEHDRDLVFRANIERLIIRWLRDYPDYQLTS